MAEKSTKGNQQKKVNLDGGNHVLSELSTRPKDLKKQIFEKSFTWRLTDEEIQQRAFVLRYSTIKNCYYRLSFNEGTIPAIEGWQNGAYGSMNAQRFRYKSGNGQEWAYLTRKPGCTSGSISWWLDFRGSGMVIDDVIAYTYGKTLRNGRITFDLLSPDLVPSDETVKNQRRRRSSLNGWQSLLVIAYLEGNASDVDTTQLFYHDANDQQDFCPLDIAITLKPLEYLICTCNSSNKLPPIIRTSSARFNNQSCNTVSGQNHRRTLSLREPLPPVKVRSNQWTPETPPRTISNPVVIEVHHNPRQSENPQLVAEVGSANHKRRKSAPSRSRAAESNHKTHPEPTKSELTDTRFRKTIATFAIDEASGSARGNDGLVQEKEVEGITPVQRSLSIQMITQEEHDHRSSTRCTLL